MAKKVIRKGDSTTHGGTVVEGISNYLVLGKEVSCKGHMVLCPKCNNLLYPIIDGVSSCIIEGKPVAVEGMQTACGASLIASQGEYTIG